MAVSDVMLLVSDPKISGTSVVLPAESTSATAPITLSWNTLNPRRCFFLAAHARKANLVGDVGSGARFRCSLP